MPDYQVFEHDNVLRFRVVSRSRPDIEHVVDIGENAGFGKCSCEHHEFRIQPLLDRGKTPETRCKHLIVSREAALRIYIARVVEMEQRNAPINGNS